MAKHKPAKGVAPEETIEQEIDVDAMTDDEFADLKTEMSDEALSGPVEPVEEAAAKEPAEVAADEPVAVAVEESTPADDADEPDDDNTLASKQDTVPHGKFHKELMKRQEAEAATARANQHVSEMLELMRAGMQPAQQQVVEAPAPPDPEEDIFGYTKHINDDLSRQINEVKAALTQSNQQRQQEAFAQGMLQQSDADINAYVAEKPEAESLVPFLQEMGREHLANQGVTDPAQQSQAMRRWQLQLAQQARSLGVRPANLLRTMAEERGWQPAQPAPATEQAAAEPAPAAAPAADPKQAIADMEKLNAAKKAATSLTGSGTEADIMPNITPETVAEMSPSEWTAFKAKYGEDAMRKVFGH